MDLMGQLKRTERGSAITGVACAALVLGCTVLLGSIPCSAEGQSDSGGFRVRGQLLQPGDNLSAGGSFEVEGRSVLPSNGTGAREFTLEPAKSKRGEGSAGCPCQGLFADGFESGDSGAWSVVSGS
jgi:hypothetical protein